MALDQYTRLHLGDPREIRLRLAAVPMATVLSLLAEVAGGRRQGVRPNVRDAVRTRLPSGAPEVIGPMFLPGSPAVPDCLTPSVGIRDASFEEHLDQIVAAAERDLVREVVSMYPDHASAPWRRALDRPGQWIDRYTAVMRAAWDSFRPWWERAQPLMERETARVGTAVVKGMVDILLTSLGPRSRFDDACLLVSDPMPERFDLGGRDLVLVPCASGVASQILAPDLPHAVWMGYPLPGLRADRAEPAGTGAPDSLSLVLGPTRALVLHGIHRATSMGRLAKALNISPAGLTYQMDLLDKAGLVHRVREGKQVVVSRTARGDELLDLLP